MAATNKKELVKMLLNSHDETKETEELLEILFDEAIAIDSDKVENENETTGEKFADKLTLVAGSWAFIIGFVLFLIFWIVLNLTFFKGVDPYPFILLNLLLSCLAALQAPIIMMSQNRQAKKDSLRSKNDYRIDLKSELILEQLHLQMQDLMRNQRRILRVLEKNDEHIEIENNK